MRITFYGAAQTVTGSKHLIETAGSYRLLLDCGMFQGGGKESREKNYHFGFAPHLVDDIILSHAHIDHSGLLPRLVAQGFKGKIYCTPATLSLCEIMLMDSAFIQENDLKYINRRRKNRGEELIDPLYDADDVLLTLQKMVAVNYGEWRQINEDVKFMFTDAGHILGSAAVNLEIQDTDETKKITFTGDIGRMNDDILRKPLGLRFTPAQEGTANALMDRFLHSLVESSKDAGYHVLLFPGDPEDPIAGIPEFDALRQKLPSCIRLQSNNLFVHEQALLLQVGGLEVWREQLAHLLRMSVRK